MSKTLSVFLFLGFVVSAQSTKTVLDGVYTAEQAVRGHEAFETSCASCHEGAAFDGTLLEGGGFINNWREDTLDALFTYMKTAMPADNPGSLSDSAYRDILASLLQVNNYPAGGKELTAETIATTLLVGEDGPQPLPPSALVQVAGCFTAGANDTWALVKASEPGRTRVSDATTAEEVKHAGSKPLGKATFKLQNLDLLPKGFKPGAYTGHKVLIKGVLIQQKNNDRINVTALASLSSTCTQ